MSTNFAILTLKELIIKTNGGEVNDRNQSNKKSTGFNISFLG